ncbi:hypothetical protein BH23THE1_BH23THE1_35510 [soil metagenome]
MRDHEEMPLDSSIYDEIHSILSTYETSLRQLYGPSIEPQYIIINGIRANFVSLPEIGNMLSRGQIEKYVIARNRLSNIYILWENGITYLVKARYNPETNQIF